MYFLVKSIKLPVLLLALLTGEHRHWFTHRKCHCEVGAMTSHQEAAVTGSSLMAAWLLTVCVYCTKNPVKDL